MTESAGGLTHVDAAGAARMVDVSAKEAGARRAVASGKVFVSAEVVAALRGDGVPKGDALAVARIAGIMGAKRTPDLIPLCHQLTIGSVYVNFVIGDADVEVEAQVETVDRTGVEMEAMTACAVAALTIYDMVKSVDRSVTIGELCLWEKTGGRSGIYRRSTPPGGSVGALDPAGGRSDGSLDALIDDALEPED
jgi:cyclic pyranopterin monophosphate synthase